MAPKKRSPPAEPARKTERPPFRAGAARSRSPPPRTRVTAKAAEEVPPLFPALEDQPPKTEVKREATLEVRPPAGREAPAATETAAVTPDATEKKDYEAPPAGEMQRMMSNLKVKAKKGDDSLAKYNALETFQDKRKYYYECWLTANPKTTDSGGVRGRKSEKLDEAVVTDHGWVDKEYVAEKLCLKDWKTSEEMHIKLKFQLSQLESRPHPARHVLKEGMDAFQYHFLELRDKETQRNKRSFELLQQTAMSQEEHEEALRTWDSGAGSTRTALPNSQPPKKRTPSRSPPHEATPGWLSTFKKEGANNLATLKRSMTISLSQADTLVKTCDDNPGLFKDSQLLQAYLDTVRTQIKSLRIAEQKAATFELKHSKTPQTEEEAKAMLAKFKAAAEEAKAVKTAFASSTSTMQTALKAKLAQLVGPVSGS